MQGTWHLKTRNQQTNNAMAEIENEATPLRSAMKDPSAPKQKKKVGVSVGFGSDDEEDAGKKEKGKEKEKASFFPKRKEAKDVEESLRVNVSEIDHFSWLKKTQSVSVFSDSPWGMLKVGLFSFFSFVC